MTPSCSKTPKYVTGIHGFLLVLLLCLVIMTVTRVDNLLIILPKFKTETWSIFMDKTSPIYNWAWGPGLVLELVSNVTMILFTVIILKLMFQERKKFTKIFMFFLIVNLTFSVIGNVWSELINAQYTSFNFSNENIRNIVNNFCFALIWGIYVLRSNRVKNTFVK